MKILRRLQNCRGIAMNVSGRQISGKYPGYTKTVSHRRQPWNSQQLYLQQNFFSAGINPNANLSVTIFVVQKSHIILSHSVSAISDAAYRTDDRESLSSLFSLEGIPSCRDPLPITNHSPNRTTFNQRLLVTIPFVPARTASFPIRRWDNAVVDESASVTSASRCSACTYFSREREQGDRRS